MATSKLKSFICSDFSFIFSIALFILILFKQALTMPFYSDDFAFLKLSHPKNITDVLYFFQPGKDYFYRPLGSEVFYTLVNMLGRSALAGHIIMYVTYIVSLWIFLIILQTITNNKHLSRIIVFIYGISFIHLFQLSQLATYQEILMLFTLLVSFYFFLKERYMLSLIFFVFALMSKETSIMYPFFLLLYSLVFDKPNRNRTLYLILFFLLSAQFSVIYYLSIRSVSTLDVYKIHLSPRLMVNNLLWYTLWSLGVPSNLYEYMPTIFRLPPPSFFYALFTINDKLYIGILLFLLGLLLISTILLILLRKIGIYSLVRGLFLYLCFALFLLPVLMIVHKWMVRLTIPYLFISIILGCLVYRIILITNRRAITMTILFAVYTLFTVTAINYHEVVGYYLTNRYIQLVAQQIFAGKDTNIQNKNAIYFSDNHSNGRLSSKNSELLFTAFSNQNYADYYLAGKQIKTLYSFQENKTPRYAYHLYSDIFTIR